LEKSKNFLIGLNCSSPGKQETKNEKSKKINKNFSTKFCAKKDQKKFGQVKNFYIGGLPQKRICMGGRGG
jgi:hypothetical protein